jgi:hypothetical protein
MWAELVGEGFYEPVDDVGPDRDARAPAALKELAAGFRQSGHDMKWLIETICATEAYQRQSRPRPESGGAVPFAANVPQPLRADQLYNAVLSALDRVDADAQAGRRRGGGGGGAYGRMRGPRTQFNVTFGYDPSDARESIVGSIPQTLAMMNSNEVAGALNARKSGLVRMLLEEIPEDDELVAELYLRMLSRPPSDGELALARAYAKEVGDRAEATEDLAWALMNSAEFKHRK